jgi:hypothetical protein
MNDGTNSQRSFLINAIYRPLGQRQMPVIGLADDACAVLWSGTETPDADAYFYVNADAAPPTPARRSDTLQLLFLSEPLCVYPIQYTHYIWRRFDFIFTSNEHLQHPRFIHCVRPFAGSLLPVPWNQDGSIQEKPDELLKRPKAICMINNNKQSRMAGELYSLRRQLALWFHQDQRIPFDVYGATPFDLPNYRGPAAAGKVETLRHYRFALCLENYYHPIWSNGYYTEKVFDALYALTVPIYLGCSNIDKYLPAACFIDYRHFTGPRHLREYLETMPDAEYLSYTAAIRAFIAETNPLEHYHWHHVYEEIATLLHAVRRDPDFVRRVRAQPLPRSYPQTERNAVALLNFYLQCLALRYPRLVRVGKRLGSLPCRGSRSASSIPE